MEKSQHPGNISWPSLRPLDDARVALRKACSTPLFEKLHQALSPARAWCVGGMVRDALLGLPIDEFDLTTPLSPDEVIRHLSHVTATVVTTGRRHGTLTVVDGGQKIEITTFRDPAAEGFGTTLIGDLAARDFTINAIVYDFVDDTFIDPLDGISDLRARVLRSAGDPRARFCEDPHRLLRMYRFGPGQGRTIDPVTWTAACSLVASIDAVAVERIKVELEKILSSTGVRAACVRMLEGGMLARILPEALPMVGFPQNEFHTEDVFHHTMSVIERAPSDPVLRWAALFHDIAKPMTFGVSEDGRRHFYCHEELGPLIARPIMERLKFSHGEQASILRVVRHHMRPINCGPAGIRRILRDLQSDYERWRQFKLADAPPIYADKEAVLELSRFDALVHQELERRSKQGTRLVIDGYTLIGLGMKPGPAMGELLRRLEELVIEDPSRNTEDYLIREAKLALGISI